MTLYQMFLQVMQGLGATCLIFFSTLIFSLPLGLFVAFGRMNGWQPFRRLTGQSHGKAARAFGQAFKPVSLLIRFLISVLRGTPLMLQLIVVFYGPYYILGISLSQSWRVGAVIIGFTINYAAYFAEIFRAGIEAVPNGQREAARVLGYTKGQTFRRIVFPQMVKHVVPPVTNEVITLVKDTSLAFVVAFPEIFTYAQRVSAAQTTIIPLFIAGAFYYIFNLIVAGVSSGIEKKMSYY